MKLPPLSHLPCHFIIKNCETHKVINISCIQ